MKKTSIITVLLIYHLYPDAIFCNLVYLPHPLWHLPLAAAAAGLVAAYELTQAGHDVTVLEARERSGGRIHTLFTPFPKLPKPQYLMFHFRRDCQSRRPHSFCCWTCIRVSRLDPRRSGIRLAGCNRNSSSFLWPLCSCYSHTNQRSWVCGTQ